MKDMKKEAIRILNAKKEQASTGADWKMAEIYTMAIKALEQEPKTGHWIYQKGYVPYKWKCNQCSAESKTDFIYCPICGAKMVEPQERGDKE